jgi:hypothetical protein
VTTGAIYFKFALGFSSTESKYFEIVNSQCFLTLTVPTSKSTTEEMHVSLVSAPDKNNGQLLLSPLLLSHKLSRNFCMSTEQWSVTKLKGNASEAKHAAVSSSSFIWLNLHAWQRSFLRHINTP